ncbi:MAG: YncE family protein [Rhodoferax sp.]|nr:YncE family protein [Rhodoferax sp.]MCF8210787.1 YncE family protein [Rhodoferax sp.]
MTIHRKIQLLGLALVSVTGMLALSPLGLGAAAPQASGKLPAVSTVPGMPAVVDPGNLYSETASDRLSATVKDDLERIYVPNLRGNSVSVIDPNTLKVIDQFKVGRSPQHVVPSWDLRTLWVANNAERGNDGSLTAVDPRTGKPGKTVKVDDPYNLYFSPDGKSAIVVAEARKRLDFRDPQTMEMQYSISVPECGGINHADFSMDGRYAIFTCEFQGTIAKVDLIERKVMGYLKLQMPKIRFSDKPLSKFEPPATEICTATKGMPQDIRISPDGKRFFIADMDADGVHIVDGESLKEIGFITTGVAAHGLYPSRDGKLLYVANRGSHKIHGPRGGPGSVTVIDFSADKIVAQWPIPGGGSPDMGNVSVDGKWLWLSGRFDDVVYRIDTSSGAVSKIKVGMEPHGLTVWPQPGRYSVGHTGNLR